MAYRSALLRCGVVALAFTLLGRAWADVPLAGFTPYVGLTLTDEYTTADDPSNPNFIFANVEEFGAVGNWLSTTGDAHFEIAIYDSGASVTLLTSEARDRFNIVGAGFAGGNIQPISGAAGTEEAIIEDPLSTFVAGLGNRNGDDPFEIDPSLLKGLSNVVVVTGPETLGLPNLVGLPLISQFATHFHSDQPHIFRHEGTTIRTPQVELQSLGTASGEGMLRADLQLLRSGTFVEPVYYFPGIPDPEDILNGEDFEFTNDPMTPSVVGLSQNGQAAMFVRSDISNDGHQERDVNMMLDTGASVTVVSTRLADRLGFDVGVDEPAFYATVIGAGGAIEAPGFIAEEFSVVVEGGELTLRDVPLLAFNLPNITELGSTLDGLLGMNVFNGRNLILDPNPIVSGGGSGPSLYISDPVTRPAVWSAATPVGNWEDAANWAPQQVPDDLSAVEIMATGAAREAVLQSETQVYTVELHGEPAAEARLSLASGSTLWVFGGTTARENATVAVGENAILDGQFLDLDGGRLSGTGLVRAEVENRFGVVSPGEPVGTLTVDGIFANRQRGTLQIDIGGTLGGEEHDVLQLEGLAVLGGTLDVRFIDLGSGLFAPSVGDTFEIITATDEMSGEFDEYLLPGGFEWDVQYNSSSVVLNVLDTQELLGDYNGNGRVEQADLDLVLLNWQESADSLPDGWVNQRPTSGIVDQAELDSVLLNWNLTAGAGTLARAAGVPEPSTVVLLACLIGTWTISRRVRRNRASL